MYLSAKQVKELYHITSQTLYNWRLRDKIKFKRLPSGKIVYLSLNDIPQKRKNVLYARVSSSDQKDDLTSQEQILRQFMSSNGIIVDDEFTDIASGINEDRKDFNKMISECLDGKIEKIFITYKDRLTRFGFGYIENILEKVGTKIIVINATKEEDFQQELTQDLVSIIHHFLIKTNSNRRKLLKKLESEIQNCINTSNSVTNIDNDNT